MTAVWIILATCFGMVLGGLSFIMGLFTGFLMLERENKKAGRPGVTS